MKNKTSTGALVLGTLGIVYGDIGTSPLYAFNEVFFGSWHLSVTPAHVAGTASLIFWLLIICMSIKYATFVLMADYEWEGWSFALLSLLQKCSGKIVTPITFLLMFAAGLLFGEGIITPAISVLSAVEGIKVAAPSLEHLVIPITLAILAVVFLFQKKGSRSVGKVYWPVMLLWFASIAGLGLYHILRYPDIILMVLNPMSALRLLVELEFKSLLLLVGAVFLALTGSEALYADLWHFWARPIRISWFFIVFPALVLNYAGQWAFLLSGETVEQGNLFFSLVPHNLLIPMVLLATLAAVIASVALIFGAYSLVSQAIVLKFFPRLRIIHTNSLTEGQIYLPFVNFVLFLGSTSLVIWFGSASRLAAAYGFAVSGVMFITSVSMLVIAWKYWKWKTWIAIGVFGAFLVLDLGFLMANSVKFFEGWFIPLAFWCFIFLITATWRWGRKMIRKAYDEYVQHRNIQWFLDLKKKLIDHNGILRDGRTRDMAIIDRAVIFLVSRPITGVTDPIPMNLRLHLKRYGSIPKMSIFLHIKQERIPYVERHYKLINLGAGVISVQANFGFMEDPDASKALRDIYKNVLFDKKFWRCTIEVSRDEFIIDENMPFVSRIFSWFFLLLVRLSIPAYRYFGLAWVESSGISKTIVPIHLSREGPRIEIPEFSLKKQKNVRTNHFGNH